MDVQQKRCELMKLYGRSWREKVQSMPDDQVVAVYFRMVKSGKIRV